MVQGIEKRKTPRAQLGTKVRWTIDDSEWYEDSSQDVSPGGMMLRTERQIEAGSTIKLKFKLPNLKLQDPIVAEANVVRVAKRRDKQIGLGLQFVTLRSNKYQAVHEFVCRILGLPMEDSFDELGSHGAAGYSFKMEHIAREAEARKIKSIEKKMAQKEEQRRQSEKKLWIRRGVRTGLFCLGLLIIIKLARFFLDLVHSLQNTM